MGALEPKFWAAFCRGVDREDLIAHQFDAPGLATPTHEVEAVLAARTRAEWEAFNAEHDCCLEPVLELDEALEDEHVRARGMVADGLLATPVKLSETPARLAPRRRRRGWASTPTRCSAEAGYDAGEIAALRDVGRGEVSDAFFVAARRRALPGDRAHERAVGPAPPCTRGRRRRC